MPRIKDIIRQIQGAVRLAPYADAAAYGYTVVSWVIGTGVATAVAWANDTMTWLTEVTGAPLGTFWYVLIFLSVALCISLGMLFVSTSLYFWRRGGAKKLIKEPSNQVAQTDHQQGGDSTLSSCDSPDVRRESEAFERCLYVGQVIFWCDPAQEQMVGIHMYCFNGSKEEIEILSVKGHVKAEEFRDNKSLMDFGRLKTPQICDDTTSMQNIRAFSEFRLSLWQPIPREMADRLLANGAKDGIDFRFDLGSLDINLCNSRNYSVRAKLPLWDGARLLKVPDHFCTHRSVIIRGKSGSAEAG